ncbi:ROK family protein [Aggregatilineales bacterium SYSU G02658]
MSAQKLSEAVVIGVDVGGTKIAASVFDASFNPLHTRVQPTPSACQPSALDGVERGTDAEADARAFGQSALLAAVVGLCHDLLWRAPTVQAIGIGMAGQVDPVRGVVTDANDNLVGARGTPLADVVRFACDRPTFAANDVRVMALAELMRGAARGCQSALCVTVGTGIGGALIQHGAVWHGAHFCAGEIGYLYAGDGHTIESRYSGPAIAQRFNAQHGTSYTLAQMAERAAAGDAACAEAIRAAADGLGRVLAPVIGLLDPEAVVVGGGVPQIGALWWDAFVAAVRAAAIPAVRGVPIRRAAFGAQSGVLGAAILAAHHQGLLS